MPILSQQSIRARKGIIEPFHERTASNGMTYGLGPAGYDVRIKQDIVVWPQQFMLSSTVERISLPADIIATVHDKSSWARQGLSVFNTVLEPGWHGYATLMLVNMSDYVIRITAGSPIAQILFHLLDEETVAPYEGRYNNQGDAPVRAILAEGS